MGVTRGGVEGTEAHRLRDTQINKELAQGIAGILMQDSGQQHPLALTTQQNYCNLTFAIYNM